MDKFENSRKAFEDMDDRRRTDNMDDFDDFMKKVDEVNCMIKGLISDDKEEREQANERADKWLENFEDKERSGKLLTRSSRSEKQEKNETNEKCSKETGRRRKKIDKTIINEKAFEEEIGQTNKEPTLDRLNTETMSQESFMAAVEADAKKRSEDRKRKISESDELKAQANKCFRNNDFEKALDLFNKAINVRKDSSLLYINRAVTLLKLGLYTKALQDCDLALRLNEDSFKALLFKAKALHQMGELEKSSECLAEAKEKFPDSLNEIEGYVKSWDESDE